MTYATLITMTSQFGEHDLIDVTDTEDPYAGVINMTRLQLAMDAANSEVDGYICTRYTVPVDPAPPFLVKVACDIARYHLVTGAARVTERDQVRYESAIKTLTNLSKGIISLGAPLPNMEPVPTQKDEILIKNVRPNDWGRTW